MQLYASTKEGEAVPAWVAERNCDYICLECGGRVRVRSGAHRRAHYYHRSPPGSCRQSGKSLVHLQVQWHLLELLDQSAALEVRFPAIHRIADVVWEKQKLIFEVQCSPITAEEVLARNRDYARLGYAVVWILHTRRFNRKRYTAAEKALQDSAHYFTNISLKGEGMIFDQYSLFDKGWRRSVIGPLPIDLSFPIPSSQKTAPAPIAHRLRHWSHAFKGDLIDLFLSDQASALMEHLNQLEPPQDNSWKTWLRASYFKLRHLYTILFRMLLESVCR